MSLHYRRCKAPNLCYKAKPNKDNTESKRPTSLTNTDEDILNKAGAKGMSPCPRNAVRSMPEVRGLFISANMLIELIRTLVVLRGVGTMKWEPREGFERREGM